MSLGFNPTRNSSNNNGNIKATSNKSSPNDDIETSGVESQQQHQQEWVEIIEPKSRTRIYANLETGACAKHPPEGVTVSKAEDFSDHWWEIYDKNTGRPYYYNPEQQKTAWTCPKETTTTDENNKQRRVLIIPVSKLQTSRRLSTSPTSNNNGAQIEKRDASTQTIASNLVTTGTQTISESSLVEEFSTKLRTNDTSLANSSTSSSCTHSTRSSIQSTTNYRAHLNHRQLSDFAGRNRNVTPLNVRPTHASETNDHDRDELDHARSSQSRRLIGNFPQAYSTNTGEEQNIDRKDRSLWLNRSKRQINEQGGDERQPSTIPTTTSTFKTGKPPSGYVNHNDLIGNNNEKRQANQPHTLTTNNLSHYLVREAQSMGIALISDDDEIDDDDLASEDDCAVDDDEDTDLRDDGSSIRGGASDLNNSREFADDSSEGWKSLSDHESPNGTSSKRMFQQTTPKSPILCEAAASFTYNELIDDRKDPASCMSQQLDHRKLVENFKKSRQSSSFGLHDSLTRSYKIDPNQAVQRIKTVADNYFGAEKESMSEKHLRQLSTLSTLPRPHKETKDKVALSKQNPLISNDIDADYDVVEENCSYYSESSRLQVNQSDTNLNVVAPNTSSVKTNSFSDQSKTTNNSHFDRNKSTRGSTFSVESFARENLARHPKKGGLLFNRKVKWSTMINWTKNSIKQPMISSVTSELSSESIASFKLIQQFMGDRKLTITKKHRQILAQSIGNDTSSTVEDELIAGRSKTLGRSGSMNVSLSSSISQGLTNIPDRLRDVLAFELIVKGCSKSALRDEIYVQLARQLTGNPSHESTEWGLILMSMLLNYFSPSSKFAPFLLSFLETHSHPIAQDVCLPRLEKRLRQNWISYCRKPVDSKEISIVRLSITKWPQYCGIFGESLDRIMTLQACSPYLKTLRLPWILTTLAEKLVETGGMETEGIFRCAADHDIIAQLRLEIDCVDFRKITDAKQLHSLLSNVQDPHVVAGLLKLFFRQLNEPVFPSDLYELCLQNCQDSQMVCRIFAERLPNLNKDVVAYLIRLLQQLSQPEQVTHTKMDSSNLSMVWAPNLLRIPEPGDSTSGSQWSIAGGGQDSSMKQQSMNTSQTTIFEQTRQEMQFIRCLILHLDTSFISGLK